MSCELDLTAFTDISEMTGLEVLQALVLGGLPHPPIADTMGFRLVSVEPGEATFECLIGSHLLIPFGTVHGGIALALVDSAAVCAVHSTLPARLGYASVETKVNYTKPLRHDSGLVTARGQILSRGNRIATAEAMLHNADGELIAHGSSTLILFPTSE